MLIFKNAKTQNIGLHPLPDPEYPDPVSPDNIKALFSGCDDFSERLIAVGGTAVTVFACWLDGTVSGSEAAEQILRPLTDADRFGAVQNPSDVADLLEKGTVYVNDMERVGTMDKLVSVLSYGYCAIVLEGVAFAFR